MVSTPVSAPSSPRRAATFGAGVLSVAASASAGSIIRNTRRRQSGRTALLSKQSALHFALHYPAGRILPNCSHAVFHCASKKLVSLFRNAALPAGIALIGESSTEDYR